MKINHSTNQLSSENSSNYEAENKPAEVVFTILNLVRIIAVALAYFFASLMGALAISNSNMEISDKFQVPYIIAVIWLIISFLFDFTQSFTKIYLPPAMRFFKNYKFIIFIYVIILFSSLIPSFLRYLYT